MKRRLKSINPPKRIAPSPASVASLHNAEPTSHARWHTVGVVLFLASAVWIVFGQTIRHDFINYDDQFYVYENPVITQGLSWDNVVWAFTHIHFYNWHPLTTLTNMLDCQLYGLNPGGHHFTSLLLHALTASCLFLMLRSLTGAFWRSAFVAAVFAIHPLRVESVAWVAERKDLLSGLFFMLTLWSYARYVKLSAADKSKGMGWYGLALGLFALGLMSKPMLVTLPFVLLLIDFWPFHRFNPSTIFVQPAACLRLLAEKLPFLVLVAADCIATVRAQQTALHSGALYGMPARIGNAILSYVDYLSQMFCPMGLAVLYPHPGNHLSLVKVVASAVVLIGISAAIWIGHKKRPYLLVGWLWYLGMLVPVIGIMQVGQQGRADRYTYLPQIGLYILIAWGVVEVCGRWRWRKVILGPLAAILVSSLMGAAYVQTSYWKNSVTLWTHTLLHTSRNYIAENSLGIALVKQGRFQEAITHYRQSIQDQPEDADYAEAHNNLGAALMELGQMDESIRHFERAIQIKPEYAEAHGNLGIAFMKSSRVTEAVQQYDRALELKPDDASAHNNLGSALVEKGHLDAAILHYKRAIQLSPDYSEAHNNLGNAQAKLGQLKEAQQHFERALQLRPNFVQAHFNLGIMLARQENWKDSADQLQQALNEALKQGTPELAKYINTQLQTVQSALSKSAKPVPGKP